MAEHNEHLRMNELYIELAKQNYQKAERVEGIEYKVGYFALSAECLLGLHGLKQIIALPILMH